MRVLDYAEHVALSVHKLPTEKTRFAISQWFSSQLCLSNLNMNRMSLTLCVSCRRSTFDVRFPSGLMARLLNDVAVVSGSSSGLGRAISMRFAAQGTRLVVYADVDEIARAAVERKAAPPTHEVMQERYCRSRALFVRTGVRIVAPIEACIEIAVDTGGLFTMWVSQGNSCFPIYLL